MAVASPIRQAARFAFHDFYDYYTETCKRNMKMDGVAISGQIGQKRGIFHFKVMLKTLETIKVVLEKENHPRLEDRTQPHFYPVLPSLKRLLVFLPEGGEQKKT